MNQNSTLRSQITQHSELQQRLEKLKDDYGLNDLQMGPLKTPLTIEFYENWLNKKQHGSMHYLDSHLEQKKNPQSLHPQLQSVITVSQSYFPTTHPLPEKNPARVALYAQNSDYHHWLGHKLQQMIATLTELYPEHHFKPYVDSGPILERNWGYEYGLGWFGKNTCLIHPKKGSLFFLAEILTSLPSDPNKDWAPLPDFCGQCQKCIDICPTQALAAPRHLVADRCISYWTIEAKEPAPPELRSKIGDWFFGCDLCQSVCPWNQKIFKTASENNFSSTHTNISPLLPLSTDQQQELVIYFRWLLTSSHRQILQKIKGTALARTGAKGLKKNALIVIGNRQIKELRTEVELLNTQELNELKLWTLQQIQ